MACGGPSSSLPSSTDGTTSRTGDTSTLSPNVSPTGPSPETTPSSTTGTTSAETPSPTSSVTSTTAPNTPLTTDISPTTTDATETSPAPSFISLKQAAAAAGRLVGVALNEAPLGSDGMYREVAAREFDYVTAENAMKWQPLQPSSASEYNWTDADAIVQFAEDNGQFVKGHTFVWYMQNPEWAEGLSAEQLRTAMQNHIRATMTRYRGKVRAWDVVNEAVDTDAATGYRENIFWQALGPTYVEEAFRYADEVRREIDPEVLLYYNEIGIERIGPKSDFAYQMTKELLAKGVPIDGIGLQSHVSTHRYPSEDDIRANLRRFGELGLSVNISEVDVRDTVLQGSAEARELAQRIAYQQIVAACVLEPKCEAITFWGFTDAYSWLLDEGDFAPLLFTSDYQKKPAYQGVLDGLSGKLPVRGENLVSNGDFAAGIEGWSASIGQLSVIAVEERSGMAACVDGRQAPEDGLVQTGLLSKSPNGGPMSFSAWVYAAEDSTVDASLLIEEAGAEPLESNVATIAARANTWTALTGYLGVGFQGTPTSLGVKLHGPASGVQLCVAEVALRPLSVE